MSARGIVREGVKGEVGRHVRHNGTGQVLFHLCNSKAAGQWVHIEGKRQREDEIKTHTHEKEREEYLLRTYQKL